MLRRRPAFLSLFLALVAVVPAVAQAPQFRADVVRTGDEPFTGTIYFGAGRMRFEGVASGQQATVIIDSGANSIIVLMPEDQSYLTMDVGAAPFSAPGASAMDPANPCSTGEVSDCRALGTETVNGYAARGWEYTRDGVRETSWIANELRFPVRTVEADGATTNFTNVQMGPQPAALFQPPANYTAMDLGALAGFGGGRGRGGRGQPPGPGRGAPPAGRGNPAAVEAGRGRGAPGGGAPAAGGMDAGAAAQMRAQFQAMGMTPEQIAQAMAQLSAVGTATNSAPWEAGDGWVIELTVTASGQNNETFPEGGTLTESYSASLQASVPLTYGTPAVGAAVGPAWQLVATLGSARALAEPLVLTGTTQYHGEMMRAAACPAENATRVVTDASGTANLTTTNHSSIEIMGAQVRWEIAGDLGTHTLGVAVGAPNDATETSTSVTTITPCPGDTGGTSTDRSTRVPQIGINIQLTGLPLPSSAGPVSGTSTTSMRFDIGSFSGDLPAQVQWTIRPM